MTFSVYVPPHSEDAKPPVVWYLSGLTCTHAHVTEGLPALIAALFPADMSRQSIFGHGMGGHGALTIALRFSDRSEAVSAFVLIVAPSQVPWGRTASSATSGTGLS